MINDQTIAYASNILGNRKHYYIGYLTGGCFIKLLVEKARIAVRRETKGLGQFRYFWILTDKGLAFAVSGDVVSVEAVKDYLNSSQHFSCTTAYEGRQSRSMSAALSKAVETHVTIPNQRTFGGSYLSK